MKFPRSSGILLHPISLPGQFGIGDFGDEATSFVEFLAAAGQKIWQVLPLGPTGYGDSPYQCFSNFAGNTLLISPKRLIDSGLLTNEDIKDHPIFPEERIDYPKVKEFKARLLQKAYRNFLELGESKEHESFERFCLAQASWLDDWALYRAIKDAQNEKPWYQWDKGLASRDKKVARSGAYYLER